MTQYIEAGGKKRPFLFRYKALKELCIALGIKLSQLSKLDDIDFSEAEKIIFLGFTHGAQSEQLEIDFKETDIEAWLDEDFPLVQKSMEVFNSQVADFMAGKKNQQPAIAKPRKKK